MCVKMTRSLVLMTSLKRNSIEKFMFEEEKPRLYDNTNKYDTCWSSSWQRFLITLVFTGKICFTSKLSATKNSRKFSFCFCILVKCTKPKKKASKFDFQILSWFQDENAKRQEFLCVRTRFCWQTTFWSLLHFQSSFRLFLVAVFSVSELLQSCLETTRQK